MSDIEAARRRAARLLALRDHSKEQLAAKLSRNHSARVVAAVVNELDQLGCLDEESAALGRARATRLQRRWGDRRIARDLRAKGFDGTIVDRVLARVNDEYPQQRCLDDLLRNRVAKSGPPSGAAELRSLFQSLVRRGFEPETVRRALELFSKKD